MKNSPAFPNYSEADGVGSCDYQLGLTKREYFALHLMAGHLVGDAVLSTPTEAPLDTPEIAARKAVQYADALIEALSKDETPSN